MELINSNRQDFALEATDPQSVEIRSKYGGPAMFIRRFNIDNQEYCAMNIEKAIRSHTPTMIKLGKAYGEATIRGLLVAHIANVIDSLGENEKMGEAEIDNIAKAIWMHPKARLLSMPSVIAFFFYLKLGYYKLYSGRARNLIESFNDYVNQAVETEGALKHKVSCEERENARLEWAKNAVPYEQSEYYKRTHQSNPLKGLA